MSRKLRYVPEDIRLVHMVGARVFHGGGDLLDAVDVDQHVQVVGGHHDLTDPDRIQPLSPPEDTQDDVVELRLPIEEYRERLCRLMEEVEEQAAADRERTGIPVLGPETILAQDPQHRPEKLAKSPAPFVHAASKAARLALYQAYSWFVAAFREAAEKLRRGDRDVSFPPGCFPPALPFVPG